MRRTLLEHGERLAFPVVGSVVGIERLAAGDLADYGIFKGFFEGVEHHPRHVGGVYQGESLSVRRGYVSPRYFQTGVRRNPVHPGVDPSELRRPAPVGHVEPEIVPRHGLSLAEQGLMARVDGRSGQQQDKACPRGNRNNRTTLIDQLF